MKENLAKLPLQSSTLLIENYSQNQRNYLQNQCLKYELIQNRQNRQKQKKTFFQLHWKGLKCKELEENILYIIQRELQINIHKVDNGLNEAAIRDN